MRAYHVSSEENETIYASFPLTTAKHETQEEGLLDCGATHNFIDIRTIIRLGIRTKQLKEPRTVTNVDGTTNRAGAITRYTNLEFEYQGKNKGLPVYITNLGKDRIILGLPWFKTFEPRINWAKGGLIGWLKVSITQGKTQINCITQATDWAIKAKKEKICLFKNEILEQYQEFADVFSEEKARRFPSTREEDHKIKFDEGTPKSFTIHTYKMDKEQTKFMRKWLKDELEKKFIQESKSPYLLPTFLIKKKEWRLPSSSRLSKTELIYHLGQNATPTYIQHYQTTWRKNSLHQVRHQNRIQQYQNQRWQPRKSGVYYTVRTIQTDGYELWTSKRTRDVYKNYEPPIPKHPEQIPQRSSHIYGWHSSGHSRRHTKT